MITPLRYKLDKLELNGTSDNKDIVVLKLEEDATTDQMASLQHELSELKQSAGWKNVVFLMLPKHISITQLSDEDLNSIGLVRK